jgi:hypothetical protein
LAIGAIHASIRDDARELEAMMVAAWLGCGTLAAIIACSGRPHAYPGGPATTLAAALCGGFLGGAFVILLARRHGVFPAISVYGASVGAIVMLDLAERASGLDRRPATEPPDGMAVVLGLPDRPLAPRRAHRHNVGR